MKTVIDNKPVKVADGMEDAKSILECLLVEWEYNYSSIMNYLTDLKDEDDENDIIEVDIDNYACMTRDTFNMVLDLLEKRRKHICGEDIWKIIKKLAPDNRFENLTDEEIDKIRDDHGSRYEELDVSIDINKDYRIECYYERVDSAEDDYCVIYKERNFFRVFNHEEELDYDTGLKQLLDNVF